MSVIALALAVLVSWDAYLVYHDKHRVDYVIREPGATVQIEGLAVQVTSMVTTYSASDRHKTMTAAPGMVYVSVGFHLKNTGSEGGSFIPEIITDDFQMKWPAKNERSTFSKPPACGYLKAGEIKECVEVFEIPKKHLTRLAGVLTFDGQDQVILRYG